MKNKQLVIGIIVGLVVLLGAGVVLASPGNFWDKVAEKAGEILGLKLSEKVSDVESLDVGEASLGAATMERKNNLALACDGSFDYTTSTFSYCLNNTGRDIILTKLSLAFDASSTPAYYSKSGQVLFAATSTNAVATSTATSPIIYQALATSTAFQTVSTSTFTAEWQRILANGEYLIFGWAGGQGNAAPGLIAAPSSTGSHSTEGYLK